MVANVAASVPPTPQRSVRSARPTAIAPPAPIARPAGVSFTLSPTISPKICPWHASSASRTQISGVRCDTANDITRTRRPSERQGKQGERGDEQRVKPRRAALPAQPLSRSVSSTAPKGIAKVVRQSGQSSLSEDPPHLFQRIACRSSRGSQVLAREDVTTYIKTADAVAFRPLP